MKVAIIGAGWYGCHLAVSLAKRGADVVLIDRESDLMLGASSKNQNRLHMGFHYPRDNATRVQSLSGYRRFLRLYSEVVNEVHPNIYAVARYDSLLDFETYIAIMKSANLPFEFIDVAELDSEMVAGCINTAEKLIDNNKARRLFRERLADSQIDLRLTQEVRASEVLKNRLYGEKYDYIINCTWGALKTGLLKKHRIYFEPCIYFYYENMVAEEKRFALTVMDGQLFSLYPFAGSTYTLTSVEHTPILQTSDYESATKAMASIDTRFIEARRADFERQVESFLPQFSSMYRYLAHELSVKTKQHVLSDTRKCVVESNGHMIDVLSGKIDTIFTAEDQVIWLIGGDGEDMRNRSKLKLNQDHDVHAKRAGRVRALHDRS